MGKKLRKGPLNSYMDPTELGAGSAMLEVSEAAKQSGSHDLWTEGEAKGRPKRLATPHPREIIELAAIASPHEGASYNPTATAHQELLLIAHTVEEQREKKAEELAALKERLASARAAGPGEIVEGVARGMVLDMPQDEEPSASVLDESELPLPKKPTKRKTAQERRKQAKARAQVSICCVLHSHRTCSIGRIPEKRPCGDGKP